MQKDALDIRLVEHVVARIFPRSSHLSIEQVDEGVSTYVYRIYYAAEKFYLRVLRSYTLLVKLCWQMPDLNKSSLCFPVWGFSWSVVGPLGKRFPLARENRCVMMRIVLE